MDENALVPRDATSPTAIERRKLFKYLPRAVERMGEAMESDNEKIALGASKFIIEQCVGKAIQRIMGDDIGGGEAAKQFAAAFKKAMDDNRAEEIQEPILEGGVRILGNPIEEDITGGVLNSDDAQDDFDV